MPTILFLSLLTSLTLAYFQPAEAQQAIKKIPVIGVFLPETDSVYASYTEAFQLGLRELGYVVGQNILLEYRYTEGDRSKLPGLAAELAQSKADMIVVVGGTLAAAKNATNTIPIVVATAGDLVGAGYVASLARPGGNITGSTNIDADLSAKRLEIFKETFPKLSRVAFLSREGNQGDRNELKETRVTAQSLEVRLQSLEIKDPSQIPGAFTSMIKERAEAIIITNNSFNFANRRSIFDLAGENRLPTMCGRAAFVEHGCLMSYAGNRLDAWRRAAYFVDKILKGAKPADLPVQQPTKFELVINLKSAKQIGLAISPNVLTRADKIIK